MNNVPRTSWKSESASSIVIPGLDLAETVLGNVRNWKFVLAIQLFLLRTPSDLVSLSLCPWGSVVYCRITTIPLPEIVEPYLQGPSKLNYSFHIQSIWNVIPQTNSSLGIMIGNHIVNYRVRMNRQIDLDIFLPSGMMRCSRFILYISSPVLESALFLRQCLSTF